MCDHPFEPLRTGCWFFSLERDVRFHFQTSNVCVWVWKDKKTKQILRRLIFPSADSWQTFSTAWGHLLCSCGSANGCEENKLLHGASGPNNHWNISEKSHNSDGGFSRSRTPPLLSWPRRWPGPGRISTCLSHNMTQAHGCLTGSKGGVLPEELCKSSSGLSRCGCVWESEAKDPVQLGSSTWSQKQAR